MSHPPLGQLGRRERQIMESVYQLGRATVAEVRARISDPPSYSAVRAMLGILEEKGLLTHEQDGPRYVYVPTVSHDKVRRSALRDVVRNLFDGSTAQAVAALIDSPDARLDEADIERLSALIHKARRQGR